MQFYRKIKKTAAVVLSAAIFGLFGTAGYYSLRLPESVTVGTAGSVQFAQYPELRCIGSVSEPRGTSDKATLSLFGAIPVKSVSVRREEPPTLIASGAPFGVKLLMEGVMVTATGKVDCAGDDVCPAELAGVEVGDVIRLADNVRLSSNADLQQVIADSGGRDVTLSLTRGSAELTACLHPVYSESAKTWRGGMWVRDSIAGIGTMTYINKETGEFAGLGHPVCDTDTGEIIPIQSGEAVPVEITGARKGVTGRAGELRGRFTRSPVIGVLDRNCASGIYGRLSESAVSALADGAEEYPLGYRQDITTGEVQVCATVSGSVPRKYAAEIESVDFSGADTSKNMVIHITDPDLLAETGGIVQGMSGSPIIQDGRLIGAVTHVFVSDPTRGYAIFAENMLE
ncbi:MAG: SpoIVB peptidase [Ruminococcus sp.]|jgi:stage IV sporulation protein B|nr:SpoIVB peptidase [Ruminococcus sp.]